MATLIVDKDSGEVRWPMGTYINQGKGCCLHDGLTVPHSHYGWAKDLFWAQFGEALSA